MTLLKVIEIVIVEAIAIVEVVVSFNLVIVVIYYNSSPIAI